MPYLSQLLNHNVEDSWGERVGKLVDVVAPPTHVAALAQASAANAGLAADAAPPVLALIVETPDEEHLRVLPAQIGHVEHDTIRLCVPRDELQSDQPQPDEVRLADEVLDMQVVDLAHKRVVRVNDARLDSNWRLLGLDCTNLGLLRWLVPASIYEALARRFPAPLLLWKQTGLLPTRAPEAPAKAPPAQPSEAPPLAHLRPADIADIVHHLSPEEGIRVLASLDEETAAEAMEEIENNHRLRLLERMDREHAISILDRMDPDDAADLLAGLPEAHAQELLSLMKREESEEVQELLAYPEDSAGGMMTTDYLLIGQDRTAAQALERLRATINQAMHAVYIYCVADDTREDEEQRLLGVISIWELLAADPARPLREFMETDLISVTPNDDPQAVAEKMAKYNLLALPVLDEQGCLQGIVTVDDALDVLLPARRRRRARRMY
jgi:magnesium transporter